MTQHPELTASESNAHRLPYLALAVAIALGYFWCTQQFFAAAHPGVDQNGYLVGGKLIAQHFSPGFLPREPYEFVGLMWVRTDAGWYYPKYPIGLPVLFAIPMWISASHGREMALLVPPICTAIALLGMFFLVRALAGSFLGICAMLLLGCAQTTLAVANSPWSHAPDLCFVVWGMFLLLRWWQSNVLWRGALAGFLLGYAVTIRYTEGLLILPIALVILMTVNPRRPRSWLRTAIPLFTWLVPVIALIAFNKIAMGTWTGYDTTNESTGFSWKEFQSKWEFMVQQLYDYGLFFILPLAVMGFVAMYRASWRMALLMTSWFVPGLIAYAAYYWGNQLGGFSYLRFFLTLFPPMIAAACWFMGFASGRRAETVTSGQPIAATLAIGVIVAISCAVGVRNMAGLLEREHAANLNLKWTCDQVTSRVPAGAILIADQVGGPISNILNFLQFAGDFELYASQAFTRAGALRGGPPGPDPDRTPDQPTPMQGAREKYLRDVVYKDKTSDGLQREEVRIVRRAFEEHRRAFVLVPSSTIGSLRSKFPVGDEFELELVAKWKDPASIPPAATMTPLMTQSRRGGGGGGGPPGRAPQAWQLFEIKLKGSTTTPADDDLLAESNTDHVAWPPPVS